MNMVGYFVSSGAAIGVFLAISLFFLKFWTRTKDRLFALFSLAFCLLGVERLILGILVPPTESQPTIYLIRLTAFFLIAAAIIDKNRAGKKP
jgi:hypothetical protein